MKERVSRIESKHHRQYDSGPGDKMKQHTPRNSKPEIGHAATGNGGDEREGKHTNPHPTNIAKKDTLARIDAGTTGGVLVLVILESCCFLSLSNLRLVPLTL